MGCSQVGVEYDPDRVSSFDVTDRELWVVGEDGPYPYQDRVAFIAHPMGLGSRLLTGDPLGVAGAGGDLSIERHGGLQRDEWKAGADVFGKVRDERGALLLHQPYLDFDAGVRQSVDGTRDVRCGVAATDYDAADTRVQDRLGARTGTALVVAGLQGHIERRARDRGAGFADRVDLGVRLTGPFVMPHREDLPVANDGCSYAWVRARTASLGILDGPSHHLAFEV